MSRNKPFLKARLEGQPKGVYIPNDYVYDENGKRHFLPNRAARRAKDKQLRNNSKADN
jgi:hypothetical protein